ncbi:Long-chain-fatty-acid--CoA ligase [Cupriavidus yeoncheonensis]|uniref:Long-chain-fatty-acid--CoA ligase n=1 Tax=Cupriavidus yeoncheonensis TaxID=1462994 RepID=A0A916IXI9_9BURK|nr:acyl-CoA synthetase [Cupriavidus yeoncheonensis]CAG2151688.1 Long-chain-fatty-acid--CoA ligase [Cupriavidus yeoncheonensis]
MNAPMPGYWTPDLLLSEADVARFERVPLAERKLPASTYEMLMDGCAIDPSKVAIHYFTDGARPRETARQVTYAELRDKVHQTANLLDDLGVGKDDVVSVLMPAIPESQFVLWGAQAAGIVNPANPMLEPDILVQMFRSAGTRILVAFGGDEHAEIWAKAEAVARGLPSLAAVIRVGGAGPAEVAGVPVIDFAEAVERYPSDRLVSGRIFSSDDTASLFHTGGTTGAPKLARNLHRNQVFWVWASRHLLGLDSTEVQVLGVPVFHVAGAVVGCFSPLVKGATVVLMTSTGFRHPSVLPNLWRIVEAFRANMLILVPTLVNQVLSIPLDGADISTLTYVASSTAPLSTTVADAFHRMTGVRIRESWGMTETTAVTCITPLVEQVKVGSSGVRLPYQRVRVVQPDGTGSVARDCAPGEPGLVIVRGPSVFPGYLGQEQAACRFDGDWLDTGDLGYLDADGWLWITGRAKDLIIRGGHNIDPKMVEEVLFGHPAVQDAAVVGAPDAHAGEVPVAYVVLKPGASASADSVLRYAAEHMPERAAIPRHCFVLPEMPKTSVGKIQKNLLRVDAIERMFRAALDGIGRSAEVKAADRGSSGFFVEIRVPTLGADDAALDGALRSFTVPYAVRLIEGA